MKPNVIDNVACPRQELSIGWAMSQPREQREAALDRVVSNLRAYEQQARQWWGSKSETFSRLCATEKGETFTHGQVVLGQLYVVGLFVIMCVASWLEGGAA